MTAPENELVSGLNAWFERDGIDALAYRFKQARYSAQPVDVVVDSRHRDLYLAIESKSIALGNGATHLYFSQHFHQGRQVSEISDWLQRTGRKGLLAVTLRRGAGRGNSTHLWPWEGVLARVREGPGWRVSEIEAWPRVPAKGGTLVFDAEVLGAEPCPGGR